MTLTIHIHCIFVVSLENVQLKTNHKLIEVSYVYEHQNAWHLTSLALDPKLMIPNIILQ